MIRTLMVASIAATLAGPGRNPANRWRPRVEGAPLHRVRDTRECPCARDTTTGDPTYGGNARTNNNATGALPNAPLSGHWFQSQFTQLLQNAFPAL
jgi:hypothetical protein